MNIMYNYEVKEGVNTLTEEKEGCWIIWSDSSRTNNILPKPEKWQERGGAQLGHIYKFQVQPWDFYVAFTYNRTS